MWSRPRSWRTPRWSRWSSLTRNPGPAGSTYNAVRLTFEKKLGVTDRDLRLAYISAIVGREINTSTALTRREAATVLGTLDYCATVEDLDAAVSAALDHRAAAAEGETP